jgi:hypothetical protein
MIDLRIKRPVLQVRVASLPIIHAATAGQAREEF